VIRLSEDVEAIVLDRSHRSRPIAAVLVGDAARRGTRIEWQPGSELTRSDIPTDAPAGTKLLWQAFCAGGRAARLGGQVIARHSRDGVHLDAAATGRASASAVREPERWREWGSPAEVQQLLKYLWLILVAHGRPAAPGADLSPGSSASAARRGRSG
jgi:hypothetical protein